MGQTKHEKSYVDFDKTYETNIIGLRGVIFFAVGLFLLVVITFGLMFYLEGVMEAREADADKNERNPMMMSEKERLPPEPRLQAAPGFNIQQPNGGEINLELKKPGAEWEALQEINRQLWENGQKTADGKIVTLPIDEAKKEYLEKAAGSNPAAQNESKTLEESRRFYSDGSSGRVASEKRR